MVRIHTVFGVLVAMMAASGAALAQPKNPSPSPSPTPSPAASPTAQPSAAAEVTAAGDSPTAIIQKYTEELRKMIGIDDRKSKVQRDEKKEKEIAAKVREFFDFQGLAQLSLGKHWKRVTQGERDEFSRLFIDLVEDSYIRRSRDLVGNYKLTFNNEVIKGDHAEVTCRVARNDADIDIKYELHKKNTNWMIFNIVLDNVDLIKNYQSQFNHIIKKSGFKELLKLMRKKLDDEDPVEAGI